MVMLGFSAKKSVPETSDVDIISGIGMEGGSNNFVCEMKKMSIFTLF